MGSSSSLGSFDGQSWRLVNTCGGVAPHGHKMLGLFSFFTDAMVRDLATAQRVAC